MRVLATMRLSSIIKHTSIQLLLAIMTQGDFELKQLDVKIIFLHGEIEKRIYMKQPKGFFQEGIENKCVISKSPFLG